MGVPERFTLFDLRVCVDGAEVTYYNVQLGEGLEFLDKQYGLVAPTISLCFPLSAAVAVLRAPSTQPEHTTLGGLRTGDVVRSVLPDGSLGWAPVIGHIHRDAATPSPFLALHTAAGATLRLSPLHFLPVAPGDAACTGGYASAVWVAAGAVAVGDGVWVVEDSASPPAPALRCSPVTSITPFSERGLSHPITASLSILVDGVAAHTFSLSPATYAPATHARAPWLLPLSAALVTAPLRAAHAALTPIALLLPRGALAAALDALATVPVPLALERLGPALPLLLAHPATTLLLSALPAAAAAALLAGVCALAQRCAGGAASASVRQRRPA